YQTAGGLVFHDVSADVVLGVGATVQPLVGLTQPANQLALDAPWNASSALPPGGTLRLVSAVGVVAIRALVVPATASEHFDTSSTNPAIAQGQVLRSELSFAVTGGKLQRDVSADLTVGPGMNIGPGPAGTIAIPALA